MIFPAIVLVASLLMLLIIDKRAVPGLAHGLYWVVGITAACVVAAYFDVGSWVTVAIAYGVATFAVLQVVGTCAAFACMGYRSRTANVAFVGGLAVLGAFSAYACFVFAHLPGLLGSLAGAAVLASFVSFRK